MFVGPGALCQPATIASLTFSIEDGFVQSARGVKFFLNVFVGKLEFSWRFPLPPAAC